MANYKVEATPPAQILNFGDLYRDWLPKEIEPHDALNRLFIPYVAKWSFGERIPVIEHERERADPTSLGAAYARLATLLAHRLDWYAMEGQGSAAELVSTRVELSKAREAERLAQAQQAARMRRTRILVALCGVLLVSLAGIGLVSWQYYLRARGVILVASQSQRAATQNLEKDGDVKLQRGDQAGALAAYEEGLAIARALGAKDMSNAQAQLDLVSSLTKVAGVSSDPNLFYKEALARLTELLGQGRLTKDQEGLIEQIREKLSGPPAKAE